MKNVKFLRIIIILAITTLIICIMNKTGLYSDYLIKKIQAGITIVAAGVFCMFNYANRSVIWIKNMGMFICGIIAYIYSYEMGYTKYIIYIIMVVFVVIMTLLINREDNKKDIIIKICKQILNMIRIILVPSILGVLNNENREVSVIVCVVVMLLYGKLYTMIFGKEFTER